MTRAFASRPAGLLLLALVVGLGVPPPAVAVAGGEDVAPLARLIVIGETHGTSPVTRKLVGAAAEAGATGCVCLGDAIYGDASATASSWREMMAPFMQPMIPTQGNHDWPWSDWSGLFPNGQPYFTKDVEGVEFIAINPEHDLLSPGTPQFKWLVKTLAARPAEDVRIVILHRPWWLPDGAVHPAEKFDTQAALPGATLERLLRDAGVDLVIAGHERNYQHSERGGMHFLIAGVGGEKFYPLDYPLEGEVIRMVHNALTLVDVMPSEVRLTTTDLDGRVVETFALARPPRAEAPVIDPRPGNSWWVQAHVRGTNVMRVEARAGEGDWVPLAKRSSGLWATSLLAPDGGVVMFRAADADGRASETGTYAWPAAVPSHYAAPDFPAPREVPEMRFTATFAPEGGKWWVSTRVEPPGVQRVEARVDDGSWVMLEAREWGQWSTGMYAPPGARVTFRAMGPEGVALSEPFSWADRISQST